MVVSIWFDSGLLLGGTWVWGLLKVGSFALQSSPFDMHFCHPRFKVLSDRLEPFVGLGCKSTVPDFL